MLVRESA